MICVSDAPAVPGMEQCVASRVHPRQLALALPHAESLTREGFTIRAQIIWAKERLVIGRGDYQWQHEPCWYVRKKNAPWFGKPGENSTIWDSPSPKFIMGGSDEEKLDHPTQKPVALIVPGGVLE